MSPRMQDGKAASALGLGEVLPLAKLLGVFSPLHLQQQAACKEIVHSGTQPFEGIVVQVTVTYLNPKDC